MSGWNGRSAASVVLAGALSLLTQAVLPPAVAVATASALALLTVHHLAPARPRTARRLPPA